MAASRSTWMVLALVLLGFLGLAFLLRNIMLVTYFYLSPEPVSLTITGASGWGMTRTMPRALLFLFGMLLPFVATDAVARDLRKRTHEMLMSTAIPSWTYVWGRYLAGLLMSLLFAILMLVAVLSLGTLLHLVAGYAPPSVLPVVALWAATVVPAVFLVSGVSFALGTLLPKWSGIIRIAVMAAWFVCAYLIAVPSDNSQSWAAWDPTTRLLSYDLEATYMRGGTLGAGVEEQRQLLEKPPANMDDFRQIQERIRQTEQRMPDLWPWVPGRLVLSLAGLGAVSLASARFRRFRE